MKKQNLLTLSVSVFLCSVVVISQERTKDKQQNNHLLKNPDIIRIDLSPRKLELNENPEVLMEPYKVGSKIYFQIQATNTSSEPVAVAIMNPYFQNRPKLLRDGQVAPYREGLDKLLEAKDKDPFKGSIQVIKLEPNEQKLIGFIYLNDWYEPLQPGHYQLSLEHRFEPGQDWVGSSSITFEVVSKKQDN